MTNFALVVDDEAAFLDAFAKKYRAWFADRGLEVRTEGSTKGALRFLRSQEGKRVQMVLVDVKLTREIKPAIRLLSFVDKALPAAKKIAFTGWAKRDDIGKLASCVRIDGYIDKSWGSTRIRQELGRVLQAAVEPKAHSRIVEAVRRWLEQHPSARRKKMLLLTGETMTIDGVLREIEKGTTLGRRQEQLLYRLAFDLWAGENTAREKDDE